MHFVAIGHRPVPLGKVADCVNGRDASVHGIKAFEHDQLRTRWVRSLEQLFEMAEIVMTPNLLFTAGPAHAFNHRIVVERVGQQQAVRQQPGDRGNAGFVRDVSRRENQCSADPAANAR
jgi:hypothetical protein